MSYTALWAKDDKLNNVELIKLQRDGLDVIKTIVEKYANDGFESISEEDRILIKWAGLYEQKPKDGHFMMRIRISSGIMNAAQARVIAGISRKYGRNIIKISTRGAIQLYWLTIEQLHYIFKELEAVGLCSFETCGDCPRTIVGNPLAGIDRNELIDTIDLVKQLDDFFLLNRDFSNLPRKLKMSISSSVFNPAHKEINDLSYTPATKIIDGKEVIGFHVWVGGGLSVKPIMAKQLDIFVRPEEVLKVAVGVATIFRDHGYRESRQHARLKFLVDDWGVDKFKSELCKLIGELPEQGENKLKDWNGSFFYGVHPQIQEGKSYVGLHVPMGHISVESFLQLADLADRYGDGKLRTTISQNIILSGIDSSYIADLLKEPVFKELPVEPNSFMQYMVACTGSELCNLAIVETRKRAMDIAHFLDQQVKEVPVRINIVGCPNNCAHAHIAEIGLRGSRIKTDTETIEAFDIYIGGTLGNDAKFSNKLDGRVAADCVDQLLLKFILYYKENRKAEESFYKFVSRVGTSAFQDILDKYNV